MKLANKNWVIACFIYCVILVTISALAYLKMLPTQLTLFPFYDTILHFILLGVAAFLTHRALGRRMLKFYTFQIPIGPFIFVIITLFDEEIMQRILPNRSVSFSDLAASILGIAFFYWIGEVWYRRRHNL